MVSMPVGLAKTFYKAFFLFLVVVVFWYCSSQPPRPQQTPVAEVAEAEKARQRKMLDCTQKGFRPPTRWEVFDMEALFKDREVTFEALLEEYYRFHLRTSAGAMQAEVASPVLRHSNNYNGLGNRQLAFVDLLMYSMVTGRVLYHEWAYPLTSSLFYSVTSHPLMEVISYETAHNFVDALPDKQRVPVSWVGCVDSVERAEMKKVLLGAELNDRAYIHIDGWSCFNLYHDTIRAIGESGAQGRRLDAARRNFAFLERTGIRDMIYAHVLPILMTPTPVVRSMMTQMHAPFQPGEKKICMALRVGAKDNSHNIDADPHKVVNFFTQCVARYANYFNQNMSVPARVFVVSDNTDIRANTVELLKRQGIPAFANSGLPVHASSGPVDVEKVKGDTCDLSRGMLFSAAEQMALVDCDVTLGALESTYHRTPMYSRVPKQWLGLVSVERYKRWGNFREVLAKGYPRVPPSTLPSNLCEDIVGPGGEVSIALKKYGYGEGKVPEVTGIR